MIADLPERAHRERIFDWHALRGPDFEAIDRDNAVVTLAVSPLEVHGPHLPTQTDVIEARALLDAAMDRMLARFARMVELRLPPLCLGTDVLPRPGSLMVRPSTLVRVVEDLGRTLARQGFRHIWISNFHGGPRHVAALEVASARVNRRYGAQMLSVFSLLVARLEARGETLDDLFRSVEGFDRADLAGDAHGGLLETSLLLLLAGGQVDPGYRSLPRKVDEPAPAGGGPGGAARAIARSMRYYMNNTYAGAPAGASAELGRAFLDRMADFAAEELTALWEGRLSERDARSPLFRFRHAVMNERLGWLGEKLAGFRQRVF